MHINYEKIHTTNAKKSYFSMTSFSTVKYMREKCDCCSVNVRVNPLTPNDPYKGRTAPLTSKVAFYIFIQEI